MKKKAKKEQDVLEYMRSISNIPRYEPMKTTLIEWCEYWLSTRANNLKDSTRSSYEYVINNHFKRVFKDMKLEDLTADDVQLFINSLIIGYQIPEPLNAKTIKNIHGVLHKALSVAVTQGCVPFNAAQGTVLPNIERTPPTPLTDAQIIKFFERIKYHEKKDIFIFALLTGLRESEIIGLTVNCFYKEEHTLKVYRQCVYNDRKHIYEFTSLKNSKMRVLSLTQQAYDILNKYCVNQGTEDFIFKNRNGRHFTPAAIYNSFKKVMRSIGCPNVRFHDLRHTHAVLSLKAGMDIKTLQYNMGHYSAAFTLDVYGHCLDEMRIHGAEQLSNYMNRFEVATSSNDNENNNK